MTHPPVLFRDREDAGRRLANALMGHARDDPVVLGIPRGGVPVAFEVARGLRAPLDVAVARKLGAPHQPELAIGAVGPGGIVVLNDEVVASTGTTPADVAAIASRENRERERREAAFREGRGPLALKGRLAILVDDGVATGATLRAAARAIRRMGPSRLVIAAPVGSPDVIAALRAEADEVVCLETPDSFQAVGQFYGHFPQVPDEEVARLLREAESLASRPSGDPEFIVSIPSDGVDLAGTLGVPDRPKGVVVFAHGMGSGRWSPRNRRVARGMREAGLATLLLDLLTPVEQKRDAESGELRFDVDLLARRLGDVIAWVRARPDVGPLPLGLFGSSTGAAAALVAAAHRPDAVRAVVSRGGRVDLAGDVLGRVRAPTVLIVGSQDRDVLALNREALATLTCEKKLRTVQGASHLFEEPGALDRVAAIAMDWFRWHLIDRTRQEAVR